MFEILLFRNTCIRQEGVKWCHWEPKVLTPEQQAVWKDHGFLPHMLHPIEGISPQALYQACHEYEDAFNPKDDPSNQPPAPVIAHLTASTFMEGIAALIGVDLIRVEVEPDRYAAYKGDAPHA